MRDSLTVLAILLIGALTAALVVPYAIDWNSHRALIERELSGTVGTAVRVGGTIDLRILPKPVLRLHGVTAGGEGGPHLTAASLDVELSFAALLRGQAEVVDAVLVDPRLSLVQRADGSFGLPLPSGPAADRVSFDHFGVRGGAVEVRFADGRGAALDAIDLDGEAASLRGPFRASGSAGAVPFRLNTGALDGTRLRVKLHLDGSGPRPDVDIDGTIAPRPGASGPGFEGSASAAGRLALAGTPADVPWWGTARLTADTDGARLAEVEIRAGADGRALVASGEGAVAPMAAGPAAATLRLHGTTLDLDALAVAPAESGVAPPQGLDLLRRLFARAEDGIGPMPLRLDLGASVDTVLSGGQATLGASATLGLGPEPGAALALSVEAPAGARLALDGRVEPGSSPPVSGPFGAGPAGSGAAFRGRAELRSDDLRRTAAWLKPLAPDFAARLAALAPGRRFAARGAVDLSAAEMTVRDLHATLDGATLAGSLSFVAAAGGGPPRLSADLSAQRLELDGLPDLAGAAAATRGLDLDLSLTAPSVTLASSAFGSVEGADLALRFTKAGDAMTLRRLAVAVDGTALVASGARDAGGARGEVRIAAPNVEPLAAVLAPLLPAPAAGALRGRAALLSPLDATLRAEAVPAEGGVLAPTRLALSGEAGGTRFDAILEPDGPADGRDAAHRPVALALHAEAADGGELLRLLGLSPAGPAAGTAHADARAKGTLADGMEGTLALALGGTELSYAGRAGLPGGSGRFALRSPDLRPALAALGLPAAPSALPAEAAGDLGWDGAAAHLDGLAATIGGSRATGHLTFAFAPGRGPAGEPAPALGGHLAIDRLAAEVLLGLALGPSAAPSPGAAWPTRAFAAPAVLPRADLGLTVADMPLRGALAGRAVSLALRTAPGSVAVADVSGRLGEGTFGGALTVRRDRPGAILSGRLAWDGVPFDAGDLAGRTGGALDLSGMGDSPASLVASLAGGGTLRLSGASLARTDPAAPARVLAAVSARDAAAERGSISAQPTPPDPEALARDLGLALDRGPLPLGDLAAPMVLAGGVLRAGPLRLSGALPTSADDGGAPVSWTAEAALAVDLGAMALSSRVSLVDLPARAGQGRAEAAVSRAGPLGGEASRRVDASALALAVQTAAIARAQDRIDVVEQDIRERAAFERQRTAAEQQKQLERERAQAAVEAGKAAEAQRAEAARQKAEDARVQAQVEAAARAEAEKQRFIDKVLKDGDPPLDAGAGAASADRLRAPDGRARRGRDPLDPPPPPPIMQEGR